jgi:putative transcriptional regulator
MPLFVALTVVFFLLGASPLGQTATERSIVLFPNLPLTTPQPQPVVAPVAELATGKLLIASRRLRDPNFAETVILLLEYSSNGAMGVVINRPTTVSLATVLSEVTALKKRNDLVYIGGPVGKDLMLLLARSPTKPEDSKQVLSDVYLVSSQTSLQQIIGRNDASLKLRAYAGYAGWAPQQLDGEVARGDWHIQSTDATAVFDTPSEQLWLELIRRSEFEWTRNLHGNERRTCSLY